MSKIVCPTCRETNLIRGGPVFPCRSCKKFLQHVECPQCEKENVWSGTFSSQEGRLVKCSSCSEDFRFFNCTKCEKTTFWTSSSSNRLVTKSCPQCKRSVNCIFCHFCSNYLVDPSVATIHDGLLQCFSCMNPHQILCCPNCSKTQIEKNFNSNEFRTSRCDSCKKDFGYFRCFHCQHTNLWPTINVNLSDFQCFSCEKDLQTSTVRRTRIRSYDERQTCFYFSECLEFVKQLQWPRNVFNTKFNKCYCRRCYSDDQPSILSVATSNYVVPRQWAGFGLGVDPFLIDDLWKSYVVVYHGTSTIAAKSILHHRQFLLPGDVLLDGSILAIRLGHIPGKKFIYTSPSISYASLDAYSEIYSFRSPKSGLFYRAKIVLQARQKPRTFGIQGETVGWGSRPICRFIPNDRIEYFTDRRSSVVPYRLLVRLEKID